MASGPPDLTVPLAAVPALGPPRRGVGAPISTRFELGDPLGSGGMGVVSEATDRECARAVAVKQLAEDGRATSPSASPERRHDALLIEEARIQGRLDHPAIPPVFELGHDAAGRPAFAMRKVSGVTLAHVLAHRDDPALAAGFPIDRLLRGFVDVCLAIEHAHQRGVLHCDLKPGNIMFDADQRVHVLDWGVATRFGPAATDDELPRRAGGTLGYMAPEQRDGTRALDGRVDVHALGCVLFELLAGEPLHPRGTVDAAVDPRPSRRPGGRGTAAILDDACVRAIARDPELRIPSAAALAAIVTDWLDRTQDPAIRGELARAYLDRAHAGFDADPTRALGDASRALALVPDHAEAVELVAALLDGDDVPAGARAEIDAHEQQAERKLARAAAISYTGFLLFPLTLLLQGDADLAVIAAVVAGWAALVALALAAARGLGPRSWLWWSVAGLAVQATLFARYLGPFVVTPGLAALTAAGAMMHPRVRHRAAVIAGLCLPLLAPFALELTGAVAPTMRFEGGQLHLRSTISALEAVPTLAGLLGTSVALLLVALVIGRLVAAPAHQARRRLAAQAWHLGRMVPTLRTVSLDSVTLTRKDRR